jgi:hypothetical protein
MFEKKSIAYRAFRNLFITSLVFTITACANNTSKQPCAHNDVRASMLSSIKVNNTNYYPVLNEMGSKNKLRFLELYNKKPVFDHCYTASVDPLFGIVVNKDKRVSHVFLKTQDETLEIYYVNGKPDKAHYKSLKLELK